MSKKNIRYLEAPGSGIYGEMTSVMFDEKPEKVVERSDDDIRTEGGFKSFRLAEIDGEVYVLVVESRYEMTTDPDEIRPHSFYEMSKDFEEAITIPHDAFNCRAQRNKIVNAIKINKDGLLETPSKEMLDDLLGRKGSYYFSCGAYQEDDWNHDDPFDVDNGQSDINDLPYEEELVPPTAFDVQIDSAVDGFVVTVGGYPVSIRNNGVLEDELGNRFEDDKLHPIDSELARAALETRRIETKFASVIQEAQRVRKNNRKDQRREFDD